MMDQTQVPHILAASHDVGLYVNLYKVATVVALLLLWSLAAQWVDRDTDVVKARREQWNLIVVSGGAVATLVLLVVPFGPGNMFILGAVLWILIAGCALLAYVVHRNGRVVPDARLFTVGHIKRRLAGSSGPKKTKDKGQRVRIANHKGEHVEFPTDRDEAIAYQALQDFLFDLLWRRASDAEIVAGKESYKLLFRIDGVATQNDEGLPTETGERICRYLKKLSGLNVEEIRRPQKGHIEIALLSQDKSPGKTEVLTSGSTAGERLRLRIQADPRILRLNEVGLATQRLDGVKRILGKAHGLLLIAVPAQHGLTTTQYAILRTHDAYMNNIHSLERRPLSDLDNISQQRYDGSNNDVNYARMLQTVLRREPDIVMVGECEDRETAIIACRAAGAGRKIYMGMQANDTFEALEKLISLVGDTKMVSKVLLGVISQRLVRRLCSECREAFEPDPITLKKLNLPADRIEHFYRPPSEPAVRRGKAVVCMNCQGSGYVGRTGVFELLVVDPEVAGLIAEGASASKVKVECRKRKMYYLQEEGLLKVIDGTTSMNEVLRCVRENHK